MVTQICCSDLLLRLVSQIGCSDLLLGLGAHIFCLGSAWLLICVAHIGAHSFRAQDPALCTSSEWRPEAHVVCCLSSEYCFDLR